MKERLVEFDTGMLAKEKGFNKETFYSWVLPVVIKRGTSEKIYRDWKIQETHPSYSSFSEISFDHGCYAPTQSLLQQWLREKHGFHIEILLHDDSPYDKFYFRVMKIGKYFSLSSGPFAGKYEEALENGLLEALNRIEDGRRENKI